MLPAVSCWATFLFLLLWLQSLAFSVFLKKKFEKNPVICFSTNCAGLKMMSHIRFKVTLKILCCTLSPLKGLDFVHTLFSI